MKKILLLLALLPALAYAQWTGDTLTIIAQQFDDLEVVAQRVEQVSTNHQTLNREQLNVENTGQNLPYLLSTIPALQVTSDDGLGVGYTYFRVRGTDHTRINMTVNDVPLNDAESQTVFWVNMTDMASSMTSIEVQRGVGTSTNGSASFGASLNMSTLGSDTVSHVTIGFNGGMYKTFKELLQTHIVLPDKRWQMNARFSKVNSDGFLYRAGSDLLSYHADLGYYGKNTHVVASFFGGKESTGMGWDGVNYETAYGVNGADRRYNPAGKYKVIDPETGKKVTKFYDNQTDNYAQQHAQLNIKHRFNQNWSFNATAHYTHGGGYYEQMEQKSLGYFGFKRLYDDWGWEIEPNEIYRKALNNHFAGLITSAKYVNEHVDVQFGAAANHYYGIHYGNLLWLDQLHAGEDEVRDNLLSANPNYEFYRNKSNKTDANVYAKVNWRVINRGKECLTLYADLQYRFVRYALSGRNADLIKKFSSKPYMQELPLTVNYHFFNPKAGLTYQNGGHLLYGSFAMANREPVRDNFTENVAYNMNTKEYSGEMPQSECLYDYELGYTYSHRRFSVGANLYFMDYDNQLVLTGEYNDVGKYRTKNVKDSYRMGIEFTGGVKITDWLRWDANVVVSRNKIQNYKQYIDLYDNQDDWNWIGQDSIQGDVTIAYSPTVTAMSLFTFDIKGFMATLQTNVTSKQYLDNTMDENAMLRAYSTTNLNLQYNLPTERWSRGNKAVPHVKLLCQINNLFNHKYANNGGAEASRFADGSRCVWYYAQAGINVHAGFVVNW